MTKLKVLYQQIADLTKPKCGQCRVPHGCCMREHCEETKRYAEEEYGISLEPTEHPTLPFMGANGCVVEPYLRPICSVHVCEKWYMTSLKFNDEYFDLRDQICEAELERIEKRAMGMIEVGKTTQGDTIYRRKNPDIGGWDYVSDSAGCGWIVVNAMACIEELEVILDDMKKRRANDYV